MDLRNKTKKIRDLIVYEFGILPQDIVVNRSEVIVVFDKDVQEYIDVDKISVFLDTMLKRKSSIRFE